MDSKGNGAAGGGGGGGGDGIGSPKRRPLRTSDRLRQRRKMFGRAYMYYKPQVLRPRKAKLKARAATSQIVKSLMHTRKRPLGADASNAVIANLRRSTRKRRISFNPDDYATDSSETEDHDLMEPRYSASKNRSGNISNHDGISRLRHKRILSNKSVPRREGLRPRRSMKAENMQLFVDSEDGDDNEEHSEEFAAEDDTENGHDVGVDAGEEEEGHGEDEAEEDDDDDDDDGEEQDGRKRYDLRNRVEVQRSSLEKVGKKRPPSPRRILQMGSKNSKDIRKGGSRGHKKHHLSIVDDSDDSLLVDELDQCQGIPWLRSGNRNGAPGLLGGMDVHGMNSWGLNIAASGWAYQGDAFANQSSGIQTAGPSSKGGADIQPLQVDESVSFNDIGGLSEYIDALKEMVFFPLLYPDFFANYHITPPRGVLLCGPPGTGKTLIARALACAASKAGQKVSFYMRKGADVLSKWVGEAERQLKLLFEEAQKNQPSIIFFDEIDGLAPVRSSKQEQIHNSIVSTLLALMDGLDSRGQVVLIGATNRIDAIDGALRRPGRFDREFIFPLPGYEARGEILEIHTRRWKEPPSKELRMELAASCVGYCGADLKALCTEAAIRAFREKYPQVYTSDDKFVIDVNSIKVDKYHFLEAMSTITPAAHRGSIVHSRPLSPIVACCLCRHLKKIMEHISDIFPCLSSSDTNKPSYFSYGSSFHLVYRPRLLICGDESVGLDHVGPAVLHELEKFPVHSLGLPSLLSDPSAKTPEEALVHIFGEARRTAPSIMYLPHFQLWWDTAHEQLKAVLMSLLDELPSDLPILLLGTSTSPSDELDETSTSIFECRNMYQVDKPSDDDRSNLFGKLIETIFSIPLEESKSRNKEQPSLSELPRAPKEASGPKASELRAMAEAEQNNLRRLRMCFRDICNRVLYDKRFSAFHYPVMEEDAPNYRSVIQNPMDIATLLQRVDCGQYLTCSAFQRDIDLIVANAKAYNGDDYTGARIVSRAYELCDAIRGMLSHIDPQLVSSCDKILAGGGPIRVPEEVGSSVLMEAPVVQLAAVTRTSARLRHVQPAVNLSQSYEALRKSKKASDNEQAGKGTEDKFRRDSLSPPSQGLDGSGSSKGKENPMADVIPEQNGTASGPSPCGSSQDEEMADENSDQIIVITQMLMERTEGYGVPQLERLYTQLLKGALAVKDEVGKGGHKVPILGYLSKFVEDDDNF